MLAVMNLTMEKPEGLVLFYIMLDLWKKVVILKNP